MCPLVAVALLIKEFVLESNATLRISAAKQTSFERWHHGLGLVNFIIQGAMAMPFKCIKGTRVAHHQGRHLLS